MRDLAVPDTSRLPPNGWPRRRCAPCSRKVRTPLHGTAARAKVLPSHISCHGPSFPHLASRSAHGPQLLFGSGAFRVTPFGETEPWPVGWLNEWLAGRTDGWIADRSQAGRSVGPPFRTSDGLVRGCAVARSVGCAVGQSRSCAVTHIGAEVALGRRSFVARCPLARPDRRERSPASPSGAPTRSQGSGGDTGGSPVRDDAVRSRRTASGRMTPCLAVPNATGSASIRRSAHDRVDASRPPPR